MPEDELLAFEFRWKQPQRKLLIEILGDVRVARLPAEETTRFTNTYDNNQGA